MRETLGFILLVSLSTAGIFLAWQLTLFFRDLLLDGIAVLVKTLRLHLDRLGRKARPHPPRFSLPSRLGWSLAAAVALVGVTFVSSFVLNASRGEQAPYYVADGELSVTRHKLLCGYVDRQGRVVIPLRYTGAKGFSEGVAAVSDNGKWGYIDGRGHPVIPFSFRLANSFKDGKAIVAFSSGGYGEIDKRGRVLRRVDRPYTESAARSGSDAQSQSAPDCDRVANTSG